MVALMNVFQIGEFFRKREGNRLVASRGGGDIPGQLREEDILQAFVPLALIFSGLRAVVFPPQRT